MNEIINPSNIYLKVSVAYPFLIHINKEHIIHNLQI